MCSLKELELCNTTQLYWLQCALYAFDWCDVVLFKDSYLM